MKRLNISGYKEQNAGDRGQKSEVRSRKNRRCAFPSALLTSGLWLLVTFLCALLASCATPKPAEMPSHKGITLNDALAQYRKISAINTVVGLEYEKNGTIMSGDASLSASPNKLALRIYYLGFLQGEVYEDNGNISSRPKMDKTKSTILVEGLKSSLFWWDITDYEILDRKDTYELRNGYRKVVVNKDSLLPVEQTIEMENGDILAIHYDSPAKIIMEDGRAAADDSPLSWYPSIVKIQLRNYIVRINVKSYSITR
ncbi:MAG TPA: hypothetical protein VK452_11160 [Dissulfurispiraceae bacterium]|nr:hypothetical protein [Dissulfurispiraceae bacterium]